MYIENRLLRLAVSALFYAFIIFMLLLAKALTNQTINIEGFFNNIMSSYLLVRIQIIVWIILSYCFWTYSVFAVKKSDS